MSFDSWLAFMAIWILASIPLGPNALFCISATASHGFRRGVWTVVGLFIASSTHLLLAISGIAAFLAANPAVFELLRWLGVGYLAWMGIGMLRSSGRVGALRATGTGSPLQLIRRSVMISLSNPKAIFAWMAVFTQFIDPAIPLGPQLAILAPSALAVTVAVYLGYCGLGQGLYRIITGRGKLWFDRLTGTTYLLFAVGLAIADARRG